MKKTLIFFLAAVLPVLSLNAQNWEDIKALSVGDTVPDIALANILQHKNPTAKLSDYKGKVIVLDFWATWCGPCIGSMPKLDSLQKQFPDNAKFFLVTTENNAPVVSLMQRRTDIDLPVIAQDTLLHYMFRHKTIPHTVVIDKQGRVASISAPTYITAGVIRDLLADKQVNIPQKNDNITFVKNKPLLLNGNAGTDDNVLYRSLLSAHIDGIPSGFGQTYYDEARSGFSCRNISIPHLFLIAMQKPAWYNRTRLFFENVKDTSRYTRDLIHGDRLYLAGWGKKHTYCYDFIGGTGFSRTERFAIMKQTLENAFKGMYNMEASLEKRNIRCYIITRKTAEINKRLIAKQTGSIKTIGSVVGKGISVFRNANISDLVDQFETNISVPFVDETSINGKIDIDIDGRMLDMARKTGDMTALRKFLNNYGLDLMEGYRKVEVLVIRENSSTDNETSQ